MDIATTVRRAMLLGAAATLAACGGAGMQSTPGPVVPGTPQSSGEPQAATGTQKLGDLGKERAVPTLAAQPNVRQKTDRHKTWVKADVKDAPRLLFISDYGGGNVDIFTMPGMVLKGDITGLSSPEGMCTDAGGNIWIANTGASEMVQYSRTGSQLRALSVPNEYPAGCAVNKMSGDLAVSNIESTSGAGSIMIFKNASGSGKTYTNSNIYEYFFLGYDSSGNLFFDGTDSTRSNSYLAELPAGSGSTKTISLSGATLHFAGLVQWYDAGNYLAVGDQQCGATSAACVYWVSVSGSIGTVTGTTTLTDYAGNPVCDLTQGVIAANGEKYVAGADYEANCGYTPTTADRWPYEAGGTPTNYNNTATFVEPIGAAISTK